MTKKIDGRSNNQPPAEHRFKPGQSGNPRGRPKKRPREFSERQLLRDVLHIAGMKVKVDMGQGKKHYTLQEAAILRMFTKAANGDNGMLKAIIPLLMEAYSQNRSDNRGAFEEISRLADYIGNLSPFSSDPFIIARIDDLRRKTKPL